MIRDPHSDENNYDCKWHWEDQSWNLEENKYVKEKLRKEFGSLKGTFVVPFDKYVMMFDSFESTLVIDDSHFF